MDKIDVVVQDGHTGRRWSWRNGQRVPVGSIQVHASDMAQCGVAITQHVAGVIDRKTRWTRQRVVFDHFAVAGIGEASSDASGPG